MDVCFLTDFPKKQGWFFPKGASLIVHTKLIQTPTRCLHYPLTPSELN
jgi:hypothetical protein